LPIPAVPQVGFKTLSPTPHSSYNRNEGGWFLFIDKGLHKYMKFSPIWCLQKINSIRRNKLQSRCLTTSGGFEHPSPTIKYKWSTNIEIHWWMLLRQSMRAFNIQECVEQWVPTPRERNSVLPK
jgi:hypothetical protein